MSNRRSFVDLYSVFVSSVNRLIPPGEETVFVKSAIVPDNSSILPIYSSVSSSYPRPYCYSFHFKIERGRSFLPTSAISILSYSCRAYLQLKNKLVSVSYTISHISVIVTGLIQY